MPNKGHSYSDGKAQHHMPCNIHWQVSQNRGMVADCNHDSWYGRCVPTFNLFSVRYESGIKCTVVLRCSLWRLKFIYIIVYINIQFVPHSERSFLLLERAIIEFCLRSKWVYCEARRKHTSTPSVENVGLIVLDLAIYIFTTRLDRFNSR